MSALSEEGREPWEHFGLNELDESRKHDVDTFIRSHRLRFKRYAHGEICA